MGDFYQLPKVISRDNPAMLEGQQIVQDLEDNRYDKSIYDNEYASQKLAQQEIKDGYSRRMDYLEAHKDDAELNAMFQRQLQAQVLPIPKKIKQKVTGTPEQRAAASKLGFGKVKEKYRVFKRSFKNVNATAVTVRESDKLKAYKNTHDTFNTEYLNLTKSMNVPTKNTVEVDALKYFVDRSEVSKKDKGKQTENNSKIIADYLYRPNQKEIFLNKICTDLINFEMTANMFTDEYLAANITSLVETACKFKAFRTIYDANEDHYAHQEAVIQKMIFERGKILEDFITSHLQQNGLKIDWKTMTTSTIVDNVEKTAAERAQARNDLVSSTVSKLNEKQADAIGVYKDMLPFKVELEKNYDSKMQKRHDALIKKIANNPVVYDTNKELLRRITGKASRYAEILQGLETQMLAYEKIMNMEDDNSLDTALRKNAAEYNLAKLQNLFTQREDQYRAYELTIISMVDGSRTFNAEETFLINDTIATEKIDRNLTELRIRKDFYEAHYKGAYGQNVAYSNVMDEYSHNVRVIDIKTMAEEIKEWKESSYNEEDQKNYSENLKKNKEICPDLLVKRDINSFYSLKPQKTEDFLSPRIDTSQLNSYYIVKRMVEQYDFIVENKLLEGKTQEVIENVTVNGKMAKIILKQWEPYMFMIENELYYNIPLGKDSIPEIFKLGIDALTRISETIRKDYTDEKGKLPKHMQTYLELVRLRIVALKSEANMHEKYKGTFMPDLECEYQNIKQSAEVTYLLQGLYEKGAENVTPDMIKITRVITEDMKADDVLPQEVKEGLGPELYMAIKHIFAKNVIDPKQVKYDAQGNVKEAYKILNQEAFTDNMRKANLFRMLWHQPEELDKDEKDELNEILAKYLKKEFQSYKSYKDDYDKGIKGYPAESKISNKPTAERLHLRKALEKNAQSRLIQKMIEANLGLEKIGIDDYQEYCEDIAFNQENINKLYDYLNENGYNSDYTFAEKKK
ncbi:hypothetical protein [Pseudobutyrivibrio sp. MD2005]|uniref:hypothetical protein n=1 Tax=Pseudobutyrivibrio sp. MD2005 TaxID=1410616 RepID=UPI000487E2A2|nr:hypothetical protein [Pseudobutyrivibrio sp. MD2005]